MMKKNSSKGYVILGILFVLVSVIAFAVPLAKTAAFWISYAFTVIAFAALGRAESLKSKFLGFPVVHIGMVYLVVQIIAFAVFLFAPALPVWSAIVAGAVIAGSSAICMIAADVGRSEIEQVSAKAGEGTFYIKRLQTDIESLADTETNAETKTALKQLAEKIRFSDPMSNKRLAELDNQISTKVAELRTMSNKAEIITELISLLEERNRKCQDMKG